MDDSKWWDDDEAITRRYLVIFPDGSTATHIMNTSSTLLKIGDIFQEKYVIYLIKKLDSEIYERVILRNKLDWFTKPESLMTSNITDHYE